MNALLQIIPEGLVESLGWTLLHSLWQGLLVLVIAAFFISVLKINSSFKRYNIMVVALGVFMMLVASTFVLSLSNQQSVGHNALLQTLPITITETVGNLGIGNVSLLTMIEANLGWLVSIWLAGFILFMVKLMGGLYYLSRLKNRTTSVVHAHVQKAFDRAIDAMDVKQRVSIKISELIDVPMVMGMFKPVILVPASLISGLSEDQIVAILSHELAHIRRHDYLVNLLQATLESAFFFNPFVWIISSYIRREREHCCDDMAVIASNDSLVYIDALARVEEIRLSPATVGITLAKNKNELLKRIQRISSKPDTRQIDFKGLLIMIAVLSIFTFSAFTYTIDKDDTTTTPEEIPSLSSVVANDSIVTEASVNKLFEQASEVTHNHSEDVDLDDGQTVSQVQDTTKNGRLRTEFTRKFKEYFADFYNNNKQEVDKMIEEMDASLKEQYELLDLMENKHEQKMIDAKELELELKRLELDRVRMRLQNENKKNQLKKRTDREQLEHEIKARSIELEMQLQRLRKTVASNRKLSEVKNSEALKTQKLALEKARKEALRQQKALELRQKALELKSLEISREQDRKERFVDELTVELIKDGYMKRGDNIATLNLVNDGTYLINGKKMKKKHLEKYNKICNKYFDTKSDGIVIMFD